MFDTILEYETDLGYGGKGEELKIMVSGYRGCKEVERNTYHVQLHREHRRENNVSWP